jgi:hypothetical protein
MVSDLELQNQMSIQIIYHAALWYIIYLFIVYLMMLFQQLKTM